MACRDDEARSQSPQLSCPVIYIHENFVEIFTLIDLLPGGPLPAILECSSHSNIDHAHKARQVLNHARLRAFVMREFPMLLRVHLCLQMIAAKPLL